MHELAEAAVEAEILHGMPEAVARGRDRWALASEFILKRMVVVTRSLYGGGGGWEGLGGRSYEARWEEERRRGDKVVVLTTLVR